MNARIARLLIGNARRRHAVFATLIAGILAGTALFASVLRASYADVGSVVTTAAANLATAVSHDVDRNIELLGLSLTSVINQWNNPAVQAMEPALRNAVLFDSYATARDSNNSIVANEFVMDESGRVAAASKSVIPVGTSFADREYFGVHVLNGDVGLFVSTPFRSRISGKWAIGFSRRLNKADGSFGGVAVATVELDYLSRLYKALNLGLDGSVTLVRTDGRIVIREPYVESDIRRIVSGNDMFNVIRSSRMGSFEGPSPIDRVHRIISFHRVGNLPLIQDVEVSVDQAYAAWWRKTLVIAAMTGFLGACTIALLVILDVELGTRAKVEAALEHMVGTDGLTQIANRRRFEEMLDTEWRRAVREGLPLSVLMIDADRFKSYNDAYGHPAGDLLLRALAQTVAGAIRRPGDLAARYGGEEFSVLLPNTDIAGAATVAESIRVAVARLAQAHAGVPGGVATVSIGVASTEPCLGRAAAEVVAAADAALYRAKEGGRDCIRAAPDPLRPDWPDGMVIGKYAASALERDAA